MCIHGFQGTRTDKVIADLGVTKGAFYHYFPDKLSMGYAVVDEILYPTYINHWTYLETRDTNIIDGICLGLDKLKSKCNEENVSYGCPLNNLIQEMSALDENFRFKLHRILQKQIDMLASAISRAKNCQEIASSVNHLNTAAFILSSIEGSYTLAKVLNSKISFDTNIDQIKIYLRLLSK